MDSEDNKCADTLTPSQRSHLMSRVKGKNTRPEKTIRSLLHRLGYRFRIHRSNLPGSPDIVLPKYKTVVFVHGCFWHRHAGCSKATMPAAHRDYWETKFAENLERDARKERELATLGWHVITVWQCETVRKRREPLVRRLEEELRSTRSHP